MKRLLFILVLALVIAMLLPFRPALRMPLMERISLAEADDEKTASLIRILNPPRDAQTLTAISVYCYGLPTDRLAAMQGLNEPTRATFYFDGFAYIGATATYTGAGEYFSLQGQSAAQLDGYTYEQWRAAQQ